MAATSPRCTSLVHFELLQEWKRRKNEEADECEAGFKIAQIADEMPGATEIKRAHSDDRKTSLFHATLLNSPSSNFAAALERLAKEANSEHGAE